MSAAHRSVYSAIAALALLLLGAARVWAADAPAQKATVFGSPAANLRAGASVEQAIKVTLKEGDSVIVEKLAGEWYLVTAADGQQGYIHKDLLKLAAADGAPGSTPKRQIAGDAPAGPAPANNAPPPVAPTAAKTGKAPAATPSPTARVKAPEGQAPSLLQILEAHETEVKIGLLIAAVAFVLGWICGGLYSVRRERKSWRRLRL